MLIWKIIRIFLNSKVGYLLDCDIIFNTIPVTTMLDQFIQFFYHLSTLQ